ncbi:MAG: hypothetical protein D6788_00555 [Planctomycetota bacterium]|nr:MAG: hypothetical protein D6788_00555 [Planctomycetota bacterium]
MITHPHHTDRLITHPHHTDRQRDRDGEPPCRLHSAASACPLVRNVDERHETIPAAREESLGRAIRPLAERRTRIFERFSFPCPEPRASARAISRHSVHTQPKAKATVSRKTLASSLFVWTLIMLPGRTAHAQTAYSSSSLQQDALTAFGLEAGTVFSLDLGGVAAGGPLQVVLPLEGSDYTLELAPASVRAPGYKLLVQQADGRIVERPSGPERTLRGAVVELPGSAAAGFVDARGVTAVLLLPGGLRYGVEPLSGVVTAARPGDHLIFPAERTIPPGGTCAEPLLPAQGGAPAPAGTVAAAAGALALTELAFDVDSDYFLQPTFQSQPDPVLAMEDHINNIVNAINVQYENDVGIRHVITRILIRTSADSDPYRTQFSYTTDPNTLLNQFRDLWAFQLGSIPRDVAQLVTGRTLDGTTIGIAFLGSVCLTGAHYSVVQQTCCSTFACKTDLSAHELGHSWGALHCGDDGPGDPNPCFPSCSTTMNCTLRCANRFGQKAIDEINAFKVTRSCLDFSDVLRRISILADTDTVPEGGTLQLTAIADFQFGADQDITDQVAWRVEPAGAATIDGNGLLSAPLVDGDTCITVFATFNDGTQDFEAGKILVIDDLDTVFGIIASDPPGGSIDARQPTTPDGGNLAGWTTVDVTFNGDPCLVTRSDFLVTHGDPSPPPFVTAVQLIQARTLRLVLQRPLTPGVWTDITFDTQTIRLGYLPGDVNADAVSNAADVAALLDVLNGATSPPPLWSTDIDRSGATGPGDLLRLIDLLQGAGAYEVWNGASLP